MLRNVLLQPFKLSFNLKVNVNGLGVAFLFLAAGPHTRLEEVVRAIGYRRAPCSVLSVNSMLKILKDGREKWTGRGNGYHMPSLIFRRSIQPSEGEEGFSKVFVLLLLKEFFPCTPPQEERKEKEKGSGP